MTDGAPLNPLLDVADEILRLNGRMRSIFKGVSEGVPLSPMGSAVLAAVVQAPQPPTVPQIGRSLGHPRQVVQRACNELKEAGLIETEPNPHHKRAPLLRASDKGRALKRDMDERAVSAANRVLSGTGTAVVSRLAEELRGFRRLIEAHLRETEAE